MSKLTKEQQLRIVQELACFRTPQEVANIVNEEFGIEVSRQAVQHYDPTVGSKPADEWCEIFRETRAKFLASVADIGIANQPFRLRELADIYATAKKMKNLPLAASILEQAAQEMGGKYTNLNRLGNPDGSPLVNAIEVIFTNAADGEG